MRAARIFATIPASVVTTSLVLLLGICVFSYVYFVAASILHVVVRQDAENRSSLSLSQISALESELISAQHTISSEMATLEGYHDNQEKVFLRRRDSGLVFGDRQ